MIEMLLARHGNNVNPNLKYTFLGEVPGPNYADIQSAAGFTTGTIRNGSTWLSFTEKSTGQNWLIAKTPVVYNVSMAVMDGLNVFEGKSIVVNDTTVYYCKSIRMTVDGTFSTSDISNGATINTYGATSVFANSDFNHIFYPIFGLSGLSIEGIQFGTAAQYPISELGFADPQNAQIGAEKNSTGYHIVINSANPTQTRFSRAGSNAAWGWRPMIRNDGPIPADYWNLVNLDFSQASTGATSFTDLNGRNFTRPVGTATVIQDTDGTNVAKLDGNGGFETDFSSVSFIGKSYAKIEVIFSPDVPPTTTSDYQTLIESGATRSPYAVGYLHTFNSAQYETWTTTKAVTPLRYSQINSSNIYPSTWQRHVIEHRIGQSIKITRYDMSGNVLGTSNGNYTELFQGNNSSTLAIGHSWVGGRRYFFNGRIKSVKMRLE